ncbi:hypothetical protein K431DRAFT_305690 [Polychaeton citri CBS 116435]|uniref:Zn(2)-C6 fungal-type domain-containing protein n=1 Tax=Polychaeton citri CBS 116435 TaxID=1314669 RepID=A0A9P4Q5N5_9PEZI|nr:hypothetical protein K431DRAFT_305690 [Polychaeton citri CBS 116435]
MPEHRTQPRRRIDRVQLACVPCRAGKLKCNHEFPTCDQCQKRNREADCNYTERGLRYNTASRDFESMRDKLERLEHFVNRLKDSNTLLPLKGKAEANEGETKITNDDTTDFIGPTGSLRYKDNTTIFIGPTHWEALVDDLADVKAYFKEEGIDAGAAETPESASTSNFSIPSIDIVMGMSGPFSKQELLRLLPQRAELDRLVSTWFDTMDGLRTILHAPSFELRYSQFWQDHTVVSNTWLACLFAIASLGAEITGQNKCDAHLLSQAEDLRRLAGHALVLADYAKIHPRTVQTILLLIQSRLIRSHDVDNETWVLMGVASRLGMRAGYHRDPSISEALPPFACEMKRRAWLHLRQLDIHVAYHLGLNSTMHSISTDTQAPLNLLDADFTFEHFPPSSRPTDECTPNMYTTHYAQLTFIFGKIVASAHVLSPQSHNETVELFEQLEGWKRTCPTVLQPVPLESTLLDPPELVLTRMKLELLRLKCIIILYRRYLEKSDFKNEAKRCLDAARESVELHISLLDASELDGRLVDCKPYIALHVHDFNLAAMVSCWQLRRSGTGIEAGTAQDQDSTIGSLARACDSWLQRGVNSARAVRALRAIDMFVRQRKQPANAELLHFDGAGMAPFTTGSQYYDGTSNQASQDWFDGQDGLFDNFFGGSLPLDDNLLDFDITDMLDTGNQHG